MQSTLKQTQMLSGLSRGVHEGGGEIMRAGILLGYCPNDIIKCSRMFIKTL